MDQLKKQKLTTDILDNLSSPYTILVKNNYTDTGSSSSGGMENIDIMMASSLRGDIGDVDDDYPQIYFRRRSSSTFSKTTTKDEEKSEVEGKGKEEDADPTSSSLVYLGGLNWLSGLDENDIAAWKLVMCSKWEPLADQSFRW